MERTSVNDATKEEIKSALTSESGQMNILSKGGDSLIVTMSIIGGDVVVMEGKLEYLHSANYVHSLHKKYFVELRQ